MLKQLDTATVKISWGKPENKQMGQYFKLFRQWLDLEAGLVLFMIAELHAKLVKFLVMRLLQSNGQNKNCKIIMVNVFAEVEGRENVESFINMAKY